MTSREFKGGGIAIPLRCCDVLSNTGTGEDFQTLNDLISIGRVVLVAQLGDLLDVKNTTSEEGKRDGKTSLEALAKVQSVLSESACKDFVNIIGNHELYNFSRTKLDELLDVKKGGLDTWHSFLPVTGSKLRVVVLDPYQISTIEGSNEENTKAAFDYLRKHNSNDITK